MSQLPVTNPRVLESLELVIDSHGLANVLHAISEICNQKSDHISTNWQDEPLAREWMRAAIQLDRAAFALPARPGIGGQR